MVYDKFVQEFFLSYFWMYFVPKTKKNFETVPMNTDQGLLLRTSRVVCKDYLYYSAKNEKYAIFGSSCIKFVMNMTHFIMNLAADVSSAFNQINYQKGLGIENSHPDFWRQCFAEVAFVSSKFQNFEGADFPRPSYTLEPTDFHTIRFYKHGWNDRWMQEIP